MLSRDGTAIAVLVALWVGLALLVDPRGDFPLNDDWAYAWSVQHFLETREFQLSDWTAVNLLAQVLWGSLFCLLFGFSFTVLRLSTLVLGLIGVVATYAVVRETRASPDVSLLAALVVALNPIYFCLANSFMADVPSFAFTIVSSYFLMRALRRSSASDLVAGVTVSLVSIVNRQTGVFVLPAFALAYLTKSGVHFRSVASAAAAILPGLALYILYPRWLELTGKMPHLYDFQTTLILRSLSTGVVDVAATYGRNLFVMSTYLGLFVLPFLVVTLSLSSRLKDIRFRKGTVVMLLVVASIAVWAARYDRMPSGGNPGNVLDVAGVGPSAISGFAAGASPFLIRRGWQAVTIAGVVGGALLLRTLFEASRRVIQSGTPSGERALSVFAMAMVFLYVAPMGALAHANWFDRYLIALLPFLMIVVSMTVHVHPRTVRHARTQFACAAIILFVYGIFAVTATHDYLSWNRVRWQAVNDLLRDSQISPRSISAGFEVSGWLFGNKLATCNPGHRETSAATDRSWKDFRCLQSDREAPYRVSRVVEPGRQIERQYAFRRWLPPAEQPVYVLRREAPGR